MAGATALSGRTVGICPGCGYPVMGPQPCAACAPLVTAAQGVTASSGPVLAADPAAFHGYHGWEVYYRTTAGDVLLPIGYEQTGPVPVADYLAAHPQ